MNGLTDGRMNGRMDRLDGKNSDLDIVFLIPVNAFPIVHLFLSFIIRIVSGFGMSIQICLKIISLPKNLLFYKLIMAKKHHEVLQLCSHTLMSALYELYKFPVFDSNVIIILHTP